MTGFRATGHGFSNQLPNAPADENTASAKLFDPIRGSSLYLFVTGVSTSWTLRGSASQTQARRTFYPQHLVQENVVVRGQCANQYEYDRIVEFVERHQHGMLGLNAASTKGNIFGEGISSDRFRPPAVQSASPVGVDFMLLPATAEDRWVDPPGDANDDYFTDAPSRAKFTGSHKGIYQLPTFHVSGIITEVRAGATRFQFAPEFELGMKVTNDLASGLPLDARDVQAALGVYTSSLGSMYKPETFDEGNVTEGDGLDPILENIGNTIDSFAEWVDGLIDGTTD